MDNLEIAKECIENTHKAWWYADKCSRAWKRAAKKWRQHFFDMRADMWKWFYKCEELDAITTQRRELLRRWNAHRVFLGHHCIFCDELPKKIRGSEEWLFDFEDRHTEDCELAEELGDDD